MTIDSDAATAQNSIERPNTIHMVGSVKIFA